MRRIPWKIVLAGCLIGLVAGCRRTSGEPSDGVSRRFMAGRESMEVEVATPERGDLAASIELVGSFLPYRRAVLVSEVDAAISDIPEREIEHNGHVFRLSLNMGSRVRKGELLVQLDDSGFQLQKQVSLASLEKAEMDLAKLKEWTRPEEIRTLTAAVREAEARRANILADLRRAEELIGTNAIARSEVDRLQSEAGVADARLERAKAALDTARDGPTPAELAVAEAEVKQAQAQVARDQWKIDHTRIVAPYDAVITDRYVDEGDRVTAMPRVEIMELMDVRFLSAEVGVPERYANSIKVGDVGSVWTAADAEAVEGVVARINDKIDRESRTFRVRMGVRNQERRFRVGQFVRVALNVRTSPRALSIAAAAVTYSGGQPHVFVVSSGRAEKRRVKLGIRNQQRVEILAGVETGEQVVVHDPSILTDGMPVRVKPISMAQLPRSN